MKRTLAVLGLVCSILLFVKYTVKEIKEIQAIKIEPIDIQKKLIKQVVKSQNYYHINFLIIQHEL